MYNTNLLLTGDTHARARAQSVCNNMAFVRADANKLKTYADMRDNSRERAFILKKLNSNCKDNVSRRYKVIEQPVSIYATLHI